MTPRRRATGHAETPIFLFLCGVAGLGVGVWTWWQKGSLPWYAWPLFFFAPPLAFVGMALATVASESLKDRFEKWRHERRKRRSSGHADTPIILLLLGGLCLFFAYAFRLPWYLWPLAFFAPIILVLLISLGIFLCVLIGELIQRSRKKRQL